MTATTLTFGDFELDPDRFELSRRGHVLRLERKPMELLLLLASSPGRVVTRNEIAARLWGADVFVDTEHGINTVVRKLRQALRDDPEQPRFVQTVTGKGYCFVGTIDQPDPAQPSPLSIPSETSSDPLAPASQEATGDRAAAHRTLRGYLPLWLLGLSAILIAILLISLRYGRAAHGQAKEAGSASISMSSALTQAHEAYTHGVYLWYAGHNEAALPYFRKATDLDPDYAPGWAGLSAYYGAGAVEGELDPRASLQPEEATARKAVQLDPALPQAHLSMAAALYLYGWNWSGALAELDRAIALDPKYAEAYHFRAKILSALNRHHEAIAAQQNAIDLDPFARPWAMSYALLLARQYGAARTEALQRLEASPQDAMTQGVLCYIYRSEGMHKESAEALERWFLLTGEKENAEHVRRAFRQGGHRAVVQWQIAGLEATPAKTYISPVALATLYAQLGNRSKTLSLLEEGFRQHSPLLLDVQNDSAYDFLHPDPRYRSLIQHIGLPAAY